MYNDALGDLQFTRDGYTVRTLLKLDEKMLKEAKKLLGVKNTSEVVRHALADRISAEARRRLA